MAQPDLLRHFFQLFRGEHEYLITLPHPQPPINSLKCTAMHSKYTKNALLKLTQNSEFLVHFECIAVHYCELDSHALHRTIQKSGEANLVRPQRSGKVFFKVTRNSQISRPRETYPYGNKALLNFTMKTC